MLVNENKVFGWERVEMVRKYAHFSVKYIDRISQLYAVGSEKLGTLLVTRHKMTKG